MPALEDVGDHNPFGGGGVRLEPADNPYGVQLEPHDGDPWAAAGIQGNAAQAAQQLQATEAQRREAMNALVRSGPGRVAAPNPYPPGSEEWEFYEQSRGQGISQAGAQTALNMIGGGSQFAERGALGAAGGAIKAFHGSPHDFEKFDVGKIGTGEGAQAYGHGLYFAENPQTALTYRQALTEHTINGQPYDLNNPLHKAVAMVDEHGSRSAAIAASKAANIHDPSLFYESVLRHLESNKPLPALKAGGHTYEVDINADPEHFLHWDKPLNKQSPYVADKLSTLVKDQDRSVEEWIRSSPGAEDRLREAGIPGIKYKDQGSRGDQFYVRQNAPGTTIPTNLHPLDPRNFYTPAEKIATKKYGVVGPGNINHAEFDTVEEARAFANKKNDEGTTHNYVVFHHDIIDILKKYGLAGLVAAGAAHFKTRDDQ